MPRARSGCLTAYLVVVTFLLAFRTVGLIVISGLSATPMTEAQIAWAIVGGAALFCALAMWFWQRWAVLTYGALCLLDVIVALYSAATSERTDVVSLVAALGGVLGVILLWLAVRKDWAMFTGRAESRRRQRSDVEERRRRQAPPQRRPHRPPPRLAKHDARIPVGTAPGATATVRDAAVKECPSCHADNDPDAAFCEQCAHSLAAPTCPACGATNRTTAAFCKRCGASLRAGDGHTPAPATTVTTEPEGGRDLDGEWQRDSPEEEELADEDQAANDERRRRAAARKRVAERVAAIPRHIRKEDERAPAVEIVRVKSCPSCRCENRGNAYRCAKCGEIFPH